MDELALLNAALGRAPDVQGAQPGSSALVPAPLGAAEVERGDEEASKLAVMGIVANAAVPSLDWLDAEVRQLKDSRCCPQVRAVALPFGASMLTECLRAPASGACRLPATSSSWRSGATCTGSTNAHASSTRSSSCNNAGHSPSALLKTERDNAMYTSTAYSRSATFAGVDS